LAIPLSDGPEPLFRQIYLNVRRSILAGRFRSDGRLPSTRDLAIATHGQPNDFDAHVPLVFWGPGFRRGVYPGRVNTVDIAPTLARLLGLTPSELLDGRVLTEAIASQD